MKLPKGVAEVVNAVTSSKTGILGVLILLVVFGISLFALMFIPSNVVAKWNDPLYWQTNPKVVAPEWSLFITQQNEPRTIHILPEEFEKYEFYVELSGIKYITLEKQIDYEYDTFPSELFTSINASFSNYKPLAIVTMTRPDGAEVILFRNILTNNGVNDFYISTDQEIRTNVYTFLDNLGLNRTNVAYPEVVLFAVNDENMLEFNSARVLKGIYEIKIELLATEESDTADGEFIIHGQIYGLAGTDSKRRDLFVGLVWGAPVALAFGLSAAIVTSVIQAFFGAISAWYGGFIDEVVQRITDVSMMLPFFATLIMISILYEVTITTLLIVVITLTIFGGITKTARSVTFQIKSEQYIEAAISYGASKARILFLYIMPRLLPYILANIVLNVPFYIFLEAALSVLGLGDPRIPTWGKIISDAFAGDAPLHGYWWWILLPAFLIILTASAFALIGYSLDKYVNPRLRER
jgi:peptide/nickel transport system permease protein